MGRRLVFTRTLWLLIASFLALILGAAAQAPDSTPTSSAPSFSTETHIRNIENGILPDPKRSHGSSGPMKLSERMAFYHVPGVSIAFIHDGKIDWARGFGVTRLGGSPITPETLFQSGSISKPVAAMAALALVQAGKLDLDADVNQYLKTWKIPSNEFTEKRRVTLRALLAHTGGVSVIGFDGYASGAPVPSLVQVLNGEKPANSAPVRVDHTPGTKWHYSGGGYTIVQLMLDDVTGEPFPQLLERLVLGPVGMKRSTYEQHLPPGLLADVAIPYDKHGKEIVGGPHVYPEMAAAGLWSTPSDLARLGIEVQNALAGKSNLVLSTAMTREMLTPVTTADMRKDSLDDWALGWTISGSATHPYAYKGGADEGYRAMMVFYNQGDGAVVMTSGDGGAVLNQEILLSIAHEYNWPDYRPQE
jgi:CubicO group peptidase (beta-lactamase class C family)